MCRLFDQAIRYRQAHKFRPTTVSLLEVDYFGRQFFFWYRLRLFPWFVRLAISHSLFLCQKSSTIFRRYPTVVRKIRWWYLLQRLVWLMSTILIPFWLLWSIWGENVFVAPEIVCHIGTLATLQPAFSWSLAVPSQVDRSKRGRLRLLSW